MKMLAARFYAPLDVRIEEVEVPRPGPGEALIKVGAATTCGTDLKAYRRGHPVLMKTVPSLFGHEVAGTIAEVGSGVERFQPGTRVVVANSAPCNHCFFCQRGRQSLCEDLLLLNGAYAEYLLVPARIVEQNVWELPPDLAFTSAALTEPLACALHGIEASDIHPGESVVIIGGGPLGLLLLTVAKMKGARVILCGRGRASEQSERECGNPESGPQASEAGESAGTRFPQGPLPEGAASARPRRGDDERLALARALGADEIIDARQIPDIAAEVAAARALTDGQRGADVVIEAVGEPALWEAAVQMVRRGGLVNFFGGCAAGTHISLATQPLHYDEITLKGVFHHTPYYFSTALQLIAQRRIPVERLISGSFPLARLHEAFERLLQHQGIKYAILPEDA